jgi:hypothetical protein
MVSGAGTVEQIVVTRGPELETVTARVPTPVPSAVPASPLSKNWRRFALPARFGSRPIAFSHFFFLLQ